LMLSGILKKKTGRGQNLNLPQSATTVNPELKKL
jgi:hypothetical protein